MDKEKLLLFKQDLEELYKKHGYFLYTDPSATDIYVCEKDEQPGSDIIEIMFDEEKEAYTLWKTKSDPYKGRSYEVIE